MGTVAGEGVMERCPSSQFRGTEGRGGRRNRINMIACHAILRLSITSLPIMRHFRQEVGRGGRPRRRSGRAPRLVWPGTCVHGAARAQRSGAGGGRGLRVREEGGGGGWGPLLSHRVSISFAAAVHASSASAAPPGSRSAASVRKIRARSAAAALPSSFGASLAGTARAPARGAAPSAASAGPKSPGSSRCTAAAANAATCRRCSACACRTA
jgi:hypothetical protein